MDLRGCGCASTSGDLPRWDLKAAWHTERRERRMEEAGCSGSVGGRFNKQRNLAMRLVLGGSKTHSSAHPLPDLDSFIEALVGLSHVSCPDGLNTTSRSPGWVLWAASGHGRGRRNTPSKERGGGKEPDCQGPAQGAAAVTSSH